MRKVRLQDRKQLAKANHRLKGITTKLGRPQGVPGVHVKGTRTITQSQEV